MNTAHVRKRAEVIMKVRCGLLSATQAAKELGVSRKTYYKWEKRGLSALLDGLAEKDSGRPRRRTATSRNWSDRSSSCARTTIY